jgi:hypothetical protein
MTEGEHPLELATGHSGGAFGVLALTTQRLFWAPCSDGQAPIRRIPLTELAGVKALRPDRHGARFETRNHALTLEVEEVIPPDILPAISRHLTGQPADTLEHDLQLA